MNGNYVQRDISIEVRDTYVVVCDELDPQHWSYAESFKQSFEDYEAGRPYFRDIALAGATMVATYKVLEHRWKGR